VSRIDPYLDPLTFNPVVAGATIPVLAASFPAGDELRNGVTNGPTGTTLHLKTDFFFATPTTRNVLADSQYGDTDNTIVVGAHLDSVLEGPGIQDNGSGSATILEIAEQMAKVKPRNHVRFMWFSAEESGLIGSDYYVETWRTMRSTTASDPDAPAGSGAIEDLFNDYFEGRGLAFEPTPFDGRSDYGPFIAAGRDDHVRAEHADDQRRRGQGQLQAQARAPGPRPVGNRGGAAARRPPRLSSPAERHPPGGGSGLQNRQAHAAHASVGSIPAPLRWPKKGV
jgi:Peptidase family M28